MTHRIGRIKVWVQDLVDVFGSPAMGDKAGKGAPYHDIEWNILGVFRYNILMFKMYTFNCDYFLC